MLKRIWYKEVVNGYTVEEIVVPSLFTLAGGFAVFWLFVRLVLE